MAMKMVDIYLSLIVIIMLKSQALMSVRWKYNGHWLVFNFIRYVRIRSIYLEIDSLLFGSLHVNLRLPSDW